MGKYPGRHTVGTCAVAPLFGNVIKVCLFHRNTPRRGELPGGTIRCCAIGNYEYLRALRHSELLGNTCAVGSFGWTLQCGELSQDFALEVLLWVTTLSVVVRHYQDANYPKALQCEELCWVTALCEATV